MTLWEAVMRWQRLRPEMKGRDFAKLAVARVAHALGVTGLGLRLVAALDTRGRLVVLAYHKVLPANLNETGDGVQTANFESHLRVLGQLFDLVGPDAGLAALAGGKARRSRYPVLVTLDDGFANNLRFAFPALKAAGAPALVFVTTGLLGTNSFIWTDEARELLLNAPLEEVALTFGGKTAVHDLHDRPARLRAASAVKKALKQLPLAEFTEAMAHLRTRSRVLHLAQADQTRLLDWDETRILRDGGVSIGSHSSQHHILSRLSTDVLVADLAESQRTLERELGAPSRLFAYPNGHTDDYDATVVAAVKAAGFDHAFTMTPCIASDDDPPHELPRVAPSDMPGEVVALELLMQLAREVWRGRRAGARPTPQKASEADVKPTSGREAV